MKKKEQNANTLILETLQLRVIYVFQQLYGIRKALLIQKKGHTFAPFES